MTVHYIIQALFVLVGTLALLAALFNWEWFFTAQNTRFIVANAGRKRARLFYAAIGILMIATGVFFFLSVRGYA
ncbi:immunity 17 family protein [Bacteroides gallinaceum]|uniref:immunity 17 family protein n=1 Tax=Bacteroides gallinaceum TaxID=1462571 RepID=UPI0015AAFFA9|nr:immunity 17 family protein [Bacteroides gallinaceum]MDM8154375.1 immunity 17 family protein [Bacteroides gallinaceum]